MDIRTNTLIFHEGELRVQTRAGVRDMASRSERMITNVIPKGARKFVEQQVMAIFGSVDEHGQPWCSVIFGEPGFMQALDEHTLVLDSERMVITNVDPFWQNIQTEASVGVLLIELSTRRRLRVNGQLQKTSGPQYSIQIEQAYPNCPKYIQRRHVHLKQTRVLSEDYTLEHGGVLFPEQCQTIVQADTFFVASAQKDINGGFHVDASHRGGQAGFVEIINNQQLRIPDFVGNSLFNTLGNFDAYPKAGLVFIDFEKNLILQLTGRPIILWDQDITNDTTGGTRRYWQFDITEWQSFSSSLIINWEFLDFSPYIP